jgi:hypothetical protein
VCPRFKIFFNLGFYLRSYGQFCVMGKTTISATLKGIFVASFSLESSR